MANEVAKPLSPGVIPQTRALAEAAPESLAELLSRDPEGYSRQDRNIVVAVLREQRARWEAAESTEAAKPRARKSVGQPPATLTTNLKLDDLDL